MVDKTELKTKQILLEPLWKMRSEFKYFAQNPPSGYEFIFDETPNERLARRLSKKDYAYTMLHFLDNILPIELAKPYYERFRKLPAGTDLTYAILHPVFRKKSWVMDMRLEHPELLIGGEKTFARWKWLIKSTLLSGYCKKIIFELEAGKNAFRESFQWPDLENKMEVVHSSVPKKHFVKTCSHKKVKLLFVNSANINSASHLNMHGGLAILKAFLILRQKYNNVELVMRSGMPQEIKKEFGQQPGITIYDEIIPWAELDREFKSSDIFVYPTNVTPSIVFLDAMSYELPIVTTDIWGNPEIVANNKTGILVHHPTAQKFTDGFIVHFDSTEFKKVIAVPPVQLIDDLVNKLSFLIEKPELRRQMGKEGRWEIEHGSFSLEKRNEKLRRILDGATE